MTIKVNDITRLELVQESHAEQIFCLVKSNKNYLKQWLPWVDFTNTIADTLEFINNSINKNTEKKGFDCSIFYKNEIVGIIGLHKIDFTNKFSSIGYWISENYQGNGIMTASCKALINYCLNDLELNRVEIRCATENFKSQAIPKRLNLKNEGVLRQIEYINGIFLDHYLFPS